MNKNDIMKFAGMFLASFLLICGLTLFYQQNQQVKKAVPKSSPAITSSSSGEETKTSTEPAPIAAKTPEEKQRVMDADLPTMEALGLSYDYVNMTLLQVIQAYMDEVGIDHSQIAFSYKDLTSGQTYAMNDTQPMTAGSTYKLPLNMLVVDEVVAGKSH